MTSIDRTRRLRAAAAERGGDGRDVGGTLVSDGLAKGIGEDDAPGAGSGIAKVR